MAGRPKGQPKTGGRKNGTTKLKDIEVGGLPEEALCQGKSLRDQPYL